MRKRRTILEKISAKSIVLILIIIFFLTISIGYSYLKQSLKITGKSTIVKNENDNNYVEGNSTYSWEITNELFTSESNLWECDINLTVINMDEDIDVWEISFNIPEGYNEQQSNFETVSLNKYEDGRLTLIGFENEPIFEKGTSKNITFHLCFDKKVDMFIENLILNGYRASS